MKKEAARVDRATPNYSQRKAGSHPMGKPPMPVMQERTCITSLLAYSVPTFPLPYTLHLTYPSNTALALGIKSMSANSW